MVRRLAFENFAATALAQRRLLPPRLRRADEQKEIDRLSASSKRLAIWGREHDNEKLVRQAKSMEKRIARLQEEQSQVAALAPWRLELRGVSLPADTWWRLVIWLGIGIAMLPDYIVGRDPGLVQLVTNADIPSFDTYFCYPAEMKNATKLKVFRDFIVAKQCDRSRSDASAASLGATPPLAASITSRSRAFLYCWLLSRCSTEPWNDAISSV